ncbi:hypothetical protein [Endozoicomonas sp. ONNA2]|uniref:hypothetical protein n=1 Tax=Endozoicomonas sp. ONNA2 TaxID=2828741 RepID=UPI0021495B38|nr:hypothetical protein [Endozoicomonas sp. ONNA2]
MDAFKSGGGFQGYHPETYQGANPAVGFSEDEGKLYGTSVTIIPHHFVESPKIPQGEKGYEARPLETRKTERTLATLSAIAMGAAAVLFIIPAAASFGAFLLGSIGAGLGAIAGPGGLFLGGVIGSSVGSFAGFAVAAYFTPYLIAKVYNLVLEACNGNGFERSDLADRVVAHYEGSTATSRA